MHIPPEIAMNILRYNPEANLDLEDRLYLYLIREIDPNFDPNLLSGDIPEPWAMFVYLVTKLGFMYLDNVDENERYLVFTTGGMDNNPYYVLDTLDDIYILNIRYCTGLWGSGYDCLLYGSEELLTMIISAIEQESRGRKDWNLHKIYQTMAKLRSSYIL